MIGSSTPTFSASVSMADDVVITSETEVGRYKINIELIDNDNYNVVETDALAFSQHYPVNWNIFGEFFVGGIISSISTQLHENTTIGFENLDSQKTQAAFETVFQNIEKAYSSKFNFTFDELLKLYKSIKNLDPEISQSIENVLFSVIKFGATK